MPCQSQSNKSNHNNDPNAQRRDNKSRSLSGFQGIGMLPFHLFGLQPTRKNSSASDARFSAQFGTVQT